MFKYQMDHDADLRLLEERHAEALFVLIERNRDHLRQWMAWLDTRQTLQDVQKFIRQSLQKFAIGDGLEVGIWYRDQLAGLIGYHHIDWLNRKTSIGYWLGEEFQGKGLMIRSCRAMMAHAFDELKLNRVEIECATENAKSRAILEKLGLKQEGLLRQPEWLYDHFVDHYLYSMLADEWRLLQKQENRRPL